MGDKRNIWVSKARAAFGENSHDITELMNIDWMFGKTIDIGGQQGLKVLNKSAMVLITAFWEAYCEDIAGEGLKHIAKHAESAKFLPEELKKQISNRIKNEKHELEMWKIADDGWRKYLRGHFEDLRQRSDYKYSGPRPDKINNWFKLTIGIEKISASWRWSGMSSDQAVKKLDRYVNLRNAIAHRGSYKGRISKDNVEAYYEFIDKIVSKTGDKVNSHVFNITKKTLW